MFIASERVLDLPGDEARVRLAGLLADGGLVTASHAAHRDGLTCAPCTGPLDGAWGASRLVQVRLLSPVYCGEETTVALRWEATGPAAGLFPVLDANLTLDPAGQRGTRLAITGSYRPPLVRSGGPDRVQLHRVATATVTSLLTGIASRLADPA